MNDRPKHVYTYTRPARSNYCFTIELDTNWDNDPAYVAEECAQHFHDNHDGWETVWPIEFLVTLTDGRQVLCYVERDVRPEFTASVIEPAPSDSAT